MKKPLIKKSKGLYILVICAGFVLAALGILAGVFGMDGRFLGFGVGLGSGIAACGFVGLMLLRQKPGDKRQREIGENEERNIKIREKAAMDAYYITLIAIFVVNFVFMFLNYTIPCFITSGLLGLHVIGYFVCLYRNAKVL